VSVTIVREAITRIGWQAGSDLAVEPLGGGITNLNYRVHVGGQSFVVRIPGRDSERLGIDRRREHACTVAAHECDVAPEAVAFFEDTGILVTRFILGAEVTDAEMHEPPMLRRVAATVRRYHAGPAFPGTFSAFQTVRDYAAWSTPRGAPLPERFGWMLRQADRLEVALGAPASPTPCHNDLLRANFIADGNRLWIIDWEYAAMGDAFFDLGNFAVHHQLTDEEEAVLLHAYFGHVTPAAVARLKLMKIISDLREAMWAMVQVTVSHLEYDFVGYGAKHFDRYVAKLADPRLASWLAEAR